MLIDHIPLAVVGDGNCLYRAISLGLFGNENHHLHVRLLAAIEIGLNSRHYDSKCNNNNCLFKDNRLVHSPIMKLIEETSSPGEWAEILSISAISAALNICISSYCPPTINRDLSNMLTRDIYSRRVKKSMESKLTVMWSMTQLPQTITEFLPNHFAVIKRKNSLSQPMHEEFVNSELNLRPCAWSTPNKDKHAAFNQNKFPIHSKTFVKRKIGNQEKVISAKKKKEITELPVDGIAQATLSRMADTNVQKQNNTERNAHGRDFQTSTKEISFLSEISSEGTALRDISHDSWLSYESAEKEMFSSFNLVDELHYQKKCDKNLLVDSVHSAKIPCNSQNTNSSSCKNASKPQQTSSIFSQLLATEEHNYEISVHSHVKDFSQKESSSCFQKLLPRGSGLQFRYLNINELLLVLEQHQHTEIFDEVPRGKKENCYFVVNNRKNIERRSNIGRSYFWDDCGSWRADGTTNKAYYLKVNATKLRKLTLKDKKFCYERQVNKKKVYTPVVPQPQKTRLLAVYRYYVKHTAGSYENRVLWRF